jgi:uncharacterized protein (DUF1800 family)
MAGDIALLLRRAGFGPTAAELAAARRAGYGAALSALVSPSGADAGAARTPPPVLGPDPFAGKRNLSPEQTTTYDRQRMAQREQLTQWWLDRMTAADHQAVEKLVFFWHGHWATSVDSVKSAQYMYRQQRTIREAPDIAAMARLMVTDLALVDYLDGQLNTKQAPNENFARELMELFLLGVGNYSEDDVREAGRALTGLTLDFVRETCGFDPKRHDNGPKTILGKTQPFDPRGLVDLLLAQPACPRFIASRLWHRYASSTQPIPQTVRDRMAAAFPAPLAMARAMFEAEEFTATRGTLVKQPVEWLVGAMRQLGLRPGSFSADVRNQVFRGLDDLGQRPFLPPNVGGWPAGHAWLTSAAAQTRLNLAALLVRLANPGRLSVEDVANRLCVDLWTDRTYAVLRDVRDARQLLILGLVSPEYLVT